SMLPHVRARVAPVGSHSEGLRSLDLPDYIADGESEARTRNLCPCVSIHLSTLAIHLEYNVRARAGIAISLPGELIGCPFHGPSSLRWPREVLHRLLPHAAQLEEPPWDPRPLHPAA